MEPTVIQTSKSINQISNWLIRKGFNKVEFVNGKSYTSTYNNANHIGYKLLERGSFISFYKEAEGGSILIFEIKNEEEELIMYCYAPIWLFGIWNKKLKFNKNPNFLSPYLKTGFYLRKNMIKFISE